MSLWKTLQTVITRVVENGKLRAGLLFLFVFHAVGIVFVASRQGPGMSSDSVFYASAARAFAATGELVTYSGMLRWQLGRQDSLPWVGQSVWVLISSPLRLRSTWRAWRSLYCSPTSSLWSH